MKILLIAPPQVFSRTQVATGVLPPLGLLYLAGYMRERGHKVQVLDSVVEAPMQISDFSDSISYRGLSIQQIVARVDIDTDVIGISNLFTMATPLVAHLFQKIKEKVPKAKLVIGGAHATAMPKKVLEQFPSIDYAILGEGEWAFDKLCQHIENKTPLENLDGVAWRENKEIKVIPRKTYIKDLDTIPFPARDLVPMEKYFEVDEAHGPTKLKWTPMMMSRGCPFTCTFCTPRLWNFSWRCRSAKNVVDEMQHCKETYGIEEFHFEDENMTLNRVKLLELCDELINRKLNIQWQTPNGIRASVTDKEMLLKMKESGCYHITVAPESGSKRVLWEIVTKRQDPEKVLQVVKDASSIGLKVAAYFVIGLPGEKPEEMEETIQYAQRLVKNGLDEAAFSLFVPLPGSDLFNKLVKEGKISDVDYDISGMGDLSKATSYNEYVTGEQLIKVRNRAYSKVHFTKLLYRPDKVAKSIWNILRQKSELKTERTINSMIKRLTGTTKSVEV